MQTSNPIVFHAQTHLNATKVQCDFISLLGGLTYIFYSTRGMSRQGAQNSRVYTLKFS